MQKEEYQLFIKGLIPKKKALRNIINAFLCGGIVALIGQVIFDLYQFIFPSYNSGNISSLMIATIIFIASILTGLCLFDKIASYAGAGSFIPITGFSNALTSCALEGKSEGPVFGIGSNMFKLAGSVIVYGVCSSIVINIFRYLISLF